MGQTSILFPAITNQRTINQLIQCTMIAQYSFSPLSIMWLGFFLAIGLFRSASGSPEPAAQAC
jgi:hypothetical protein